MSVGVVTLPAMSERPDFSRFPNVMFVEGESSNSVIFSPGFGYPGSGYDWEWEVEAALIGREPPIGRFSFDSEAGMFCAYGDDLKALEIVAATLESLLADPETLAAVAAANREPS